MSLLFKNLRIHQIFGANTDVGKTVLTSALVRASAASGRSVYYLKPVSTGPLSDADDEYVLCHVHSIVPVCLIFVIDECLCWLGTTRVECIANVSSALCANILSFNSGDDLTLLQGTLKFLRDPNWAADWAINVP